MNPRKFNVYDDGNSSNVLSGLTEDEMTDIFGEDVRCDTTKDKISSRARTAGVLVCVSNCGIIYQIREMWRSEAIEQVVLFLFDIVNHYHELGILMPIVLCYDDSCHLLGRLLSLMGSFWQASLLVCMVIALDGFHMVNHTNEFCFGALNPRRFPQLNEINTQTCEQTKVSLNRHRNHLRQKMGPPFVFSFSSAQI